VCACEWQALTQELFGDGILGSDGASWLSKRKAASAIFTLRLLREGMSPVFSEHAELVVNLLKEKCATRSSIDMQALFFRFTMVQRAPLWFLSELWSC
jgi:hypothetical protein